MKFVCAILALSILPIAACSDGAESETFIAPEGCDWDDDGYLAAGERCRGDDCDDDRADISPGMTEICNFQDDDCDGSLNEELECRVYGAEEGVLIAVDPFIIDAEEFIASSPPGRWLDIAMGSDGSLWALGEEVVWRLQSDFWAEVSSHPMTGPSGFCESFDGHFWLLAGRELVEWSPVLGELRRFTAPENFYGSGDCVDIKGMVYMSDLSSLPGGDSLWVFDSLEARFESRGLTGVDKLYGLARVQGTLVALTGEGETVIVDPVTADAFITGMFRNYNFVGAASAEPYQNVGP